MLSCSRAGVIRCGRVGTMAVENVANLSLDHYLKRLSFHHCHDERRWEQL